jgi:hypothetical protein
VVSTAVQLLNGARAVLAGDFEALFRRLPAPDQAAICDILRTQVGKAALRKKNANLTAFSSGQWSRRSVDDWQTLEIGDE